MGRKWNRRDEHIKIKLVAVKNHRTNSNNWYNMNKINLSRKHLDIIINKENNTYYIEIYGLPNWGALNKKEYEKQEKFLSELYIEDESYTMYASYDVDYWMIKQEEPNYININIEIKEIINSKYPFKKGVSTTIKVTLWYW